MIKERLEAEAAAGLINLYSHKDTIDVLPIQITRDATGMKGKLQFFLCSATAIQLTLLHRKREISIKKNREERNRHPIVSLLQSQTVNINISSL